MPLDGWMPVWDARSTHAIEVAAPVERVYQSLLEVDFSRNPLVRTLMALRVLPGFVVAPRQTWKRWGRATGGARAGPARGLLGGNFTPLEVRQPTELVLGLTGRFWSLTGGLVATDPARFHEPVPPGLARAAWGFHLTQSGSDRTRLTTETRVLCADAPTRRRFLRYWQLIRAGSGLIRRTLLWQVKRAAEG